MAVLQRHKSTIYGLVTELAALELADSNEVAARIAGDEANAGTITTEVSRLDGLVSTLDASTTASVNTLTTDLATEASTRADADTALAADLATETAARTAADTTLTTDLAAETAARIAADTDHVSRLSQLESGMIAGTLWKASVPTIGDLDLLDPAELVNGWAYYVTNEKDAYVVVDGTSGDYVPSGWTDKSFIKFADYTELSGLVSTEEAARIAADTAEATARADGDATLQGNIDAEATARSTADTTLQGNIDAAVTSLTAADATKLSIDSNLGDVADVETARTNLDVYSKTESDAAITTGGAIFYAEYLTVANDQVTLTYAPKNGMVFNFATVRHTDANFVSYDIPVTVGGTAEVYNLHPNVAGEFDTKQVFVQYAYTPSV